MGKVYNLLIPLVILFLFISLLWYIFWTFVLKPNPLIRDFFDLQQPGDLKDNESSKKNN
jgi:hypothetical protein